MKSNCVFWAISQWLKRGGKIKVSRSPGYWYVPRTFYSEDGTNWFYFCPIKRNKSPTVLQNLFPIHTLWFEGKIIRVNT